MTGAPNASPRRAQPRPPKRTGRIVAAIAALVAVIVSIPVYNLVIAKTASAPPEERTAAIFCSTLEQEKNEYLKKYNGTPDDAMSGALQAIGAISALPGIFDRLAKVAPDEIQGDIERIHDVLEDQIGNVANVALAPEEAVKRALAAGMIAYDSFAHFDSYVRSNCANNAPTSQPSASAHAEAQASLKQAEKALRHAIKENQGVDLTFKSYFDSLSDTEANAKYHLQHYRDSYPPDPGISCDDAPDDLKADRKEAKLIFTQMKNSQIDPAELEAKKAAVSAAAPNSGSVTVDTIRVMQTASDLIAKAEKANAKANRKMKLRLKKFDIYVDQAEALC